MTAGDFTSVLGGRSVNRVNPCDARKLHLVRPTVCPSVGGDDLCAARGALWASRQTDISNCELQPINHQH